MSCYGNSKAPAADLSHTVCSGMIANGGRGEPQNNNSLICCCWKPRACVRRAKWTPWSQAAMPVLSIL